MIKEIQYVFLDSGLGGLPYLQCLLEKEKSAKTLYVADVQNFPYGTKTKEEVISASCSIVEKIVKTFAPQLIIVACNTITVCALDVLRASFSIPFVGTVPAIKVGERITKNNKIGLIGTERTISDEYIERLLLQTSKKCTLYPKAETELVEKIENGLMFESKEEQIKAISPIMQHFAKLNCDVLVLGCTHFLHLREAFIKEGKTCNIEIADSLEGVVTQALKISPCKGAIDSARYFYATGMEGEKSKYREYASKWNLEFLEKL